MPLKHTVEEVHLKNGATGLLLYAPGSTSVRYSIQFRAGTNYAKRSSISQVAHIMEHMAFGANERYKTADAFSQEFTKNGAYSNAWTGSTHMVYTVDAALMEWDRILELEQLSIARPLFQESSLRAEKGNVREELIGYATNHGRILWQEIMRKAGLKRWYDPDELETVDVVTLDDIKEHHQRTHTLKNMKFIIAGDLQQHRDELLSRLEAWNLPEGELLQLEKDDWHSSGLVHLRRYDLPNLTFSLHFFLERKLTWREARAMNALNHVLTGTFHSRIWGTARQRGVCYGMHSWIDEDPTGKLEWGFGGQVSIENAGELFRLIVEQLQIIREQGITETELAQAKEHRMGALQMGADTTRSLVNWYADEYFDSGEIDHLDKMPELIAGTTVEEIRQLADEFLSSGRWGFGGIGNITKKELKSHYDLIEKTLLKG